MPKATRRISRTRGLPPGTLVYIGPEKQGKTRITVIDYDEKDFQEKKVERVEDCFSFKDTQTVSWINVDGVHEIDVIEKVGKHFGFHPLVLEDIVNTGQRPKLEYFEENIFVVLKMLSYNDKDQRINVEQVSLILGQNYVISFQEREGDVFDPIRERIRNAKGRIRKMGADYLMYSLLDAVIDNYFLILEKLGEKIEAMEEVLVKDPKPKTLRIIHALKRDTIFLRRSIWPLREIINSLQRGESSLIKESTIIYLRDIYDHTIQVIETTESLRDMVSGILDMYLSSVSNKMNEVMKVLTIFASIFIPLTFIAGVYGMNFKYMPELGWHWGYYTTLGLMALVGITMLISFKRKKWF